MFSIFTSILKLSFLTCTKSTQILITDIHCINHTALNLLMHSNIIWSALRTQKNFRYFCSIWPGKLVSGQQMQENKYRSIYICTVYCRLNDLSNGHTSLKRFRKGTITYIYKNTLNGLCKSFISMILIYTSNELFGLVFLYSICCTAKKWSFPLRISSVNMTKFCSFLRIWSHLLKKFLMENFIFCAVLPFWNVLKSGVVYKL